MADTSLATRNQAQGWFEASDRKRLQERQKAATFFQGLKTFDDVDRRLLRGRGHSAVTYKSYKQACKLYWQFVDGNVLGATLGDIEGFFDDIAERHSHDTAATRIVALKQLYKAIAEHMPEGDYVNPFDGMPDKLRKKFGRKNGHKIQALGVSEVAKVLKHLSRDRSKRGRRNYAIISLAFGSGLRAAEICGLTWADLEYVPDDARWYANGIGKGGAEFHQQLRPETVDAIKRASKGKHKTTDPLFRTSKGNALCPGSLWFIWKNIDKQLKAKKVLTRKITFSPHLARRSFCTNLNKLGLSVPEIQALSRHKSADVLLKHYVAVDPEVPNVLGASTL